ncbi:hypothetical protein [Methylobacterium brachythecii]|uniref:Uncharacterized protein n=1 Tax=Methylobacterium brachythecii TaxID=1176177 RepID=A0A7W6AQY2_9HYPH|nr:hypothetical protein [Methylobacterium brachythecii]MBB3905086.1 hypothetical protein [Methylobacterium brachythecii]GLS44407.1 hypothetical protein GCM10007884_23950 [Methylobacterium brachythecii]
MHHLEFAALESASLNSDAAWERWVARAERAFGRDFSLDGNQDTDGYSIDGALAAFEGGSTVAEYVAHVRVNVAALAKAA